MRISYLELRNYRKFRDLKLQFPDGVIGILGLNGAGKTTIIEAVAWSLFGNVDEVVRTSRESIRRLGSGSSESISVALEFDLEGTEYRLEREMGGRNLSMKAALKSRGEVIAEGDRAVRAKVLDLIGMDHKSFFTSVFARQKELNELQNFTPGERKKVVLRMLRIDGVDSVIQSVREDRRDARERIRGAEAILLDSSGTDREETLRSGVKTISEDLEGAGAKLRSAKEKEDALGKIVKEVRQRRDALRNEVERLNSVCTELRGRRSAIAEQKASEQQLSRRIAETEALQSRLPDLELAESDWHKAKKAKERMDEEKAKSDRREHIREDLASIKKDVAAIKKDVSRLEGQRKLEKDIASTIDSVKKDRSESEKEKERLAREIAQLGAKVSERKAGLESQRKRLSEIEGAGEKGTCPTCERTLEGSYELLVRKLGKEVDDSERQISEYDKHALEAKKSLDAMDNRIEALEKKLQHQEEKLVKTRAALMSIAARDAELERLEARLAKKREEIEGLGKIAYSADEHRAIISSLEALQKSRDELVKVRDRIQQMEPMRGQLEALRKEMDGNLREEAKLADQEKALAPKRTQYDASIKEFDEGYLALSSSKDNTHALSKEHDRLKAELESLKKELALIEEQKRAIASERGLVEDLGSLEEALVNFKDHLMGKVAPALGEATSEILDLMSDGKYGEVELDDDYQISIEDQGTLHPLNRFSGGEADLANLSLRLAISRVIAERAGTSQMNFLILDEIFGSLDPQRKRSVMAALSGLSSQFRQVMLITHVEDIKDLMMTVVRVEELPDGTSTAKIVS